MSIGTYGEPDAVSNASDYAKFFSRSHDAVIRVYDDAGNVIETHEHSGDSRNRRLLFVWLLYSFTKSFAQQPDGLENKFIAMFPSNRANCHESHSNSGSKTANS
jgi:hypothetical protein